MGRAALPAWPELFQHGAPLPLSSWPIGIGYNGGFKPLKIIKPSAKADDPSIAFEADKTHAARWKAGIDQAHASVWFGGHWYWDWADDFLPAASISYEGIVAMALAPKYGIGKYVN